MWSRVLFKNVLDLCAAWLAVFPRAHAADPNLNYPLNFVYGNEGIAPLLQNMTFQQITGNISSISPPITAAIPVLLNSNLTDPNINQTMQPIIQYFNNLNIPMYLAIANTTVGELMNSTRFIEIAESYAPYTDCININGIYYNNGPEAFVQTISYLVNKLGFKHIQLNPWPGAQTYPGSSPYPTFTQSEVDSAFEQVIPLSSGTASAWQLNAGRATRIFNAQPTAQIAVNYENPPEEIELTTLSHAAQIQAFETTLSDIYNSGWGPTDNGGNNTVHWTGPWSENYDPFAQGTWDFIRNQLEGKGYDE